MLRLATYNVENLFTRVKAFNTPTFTEGDQVLAAFHGFNRMAAQPKYLEQDKVGMLAALQTLRVLVRTHAGLRVNPRPFEDAWASLRDDHGEFLLTRNYTAPWIKA